MTVQEIHDEIAKIDMAIQCARTDQIEVIFTRREDEMKRSQALLLKQAQDSVDIATRRLEEANQRQRDTINGCRIELEKLTDNYLNGDVHIANLQTQRSELQRQLKKASVETQVEKLAKLEAQIAALKKEMESPK